MCAMNALEVIDQPSFDRNQDAGRRLEVLPVIGAIVRTSKAQEAQCWSVAVANQRRLQSSELEPSSVVDAPLT